MKGIQVGGRGYSILALPLRLGFGAFCPVERVYTLAPFEDCALLKLFQLSPPHLRQPKFHHWFHSQLPHLSIGHSRLVKVRRDFASAQPIDHVGQQDERM